MISGWLRPEILEAVDQLRPIATELDISMSQLALAWALSNPNVSAVVMGASRPEQVSENAKASGVILDSSILTSIDKILGELPERDPSHNQSPNPRA
jgi:aryl-alcohol dehydrogenase-like predicted oxidoreductase